MRIVASVVLFAVVLAACATEKVLTDKQYFDGGAQALDEESYDLAIEQYQKLMEEYPFSDYTEEAQLKLAYAQYLNEQYAEAIASFQDFQRMHPTNANLPFAEYHMALAFMDQMGKKDRDQKAADNAHVHFQSLIDRYPDSPYADKAREKLHEIREELAGHELGVARFYLHWGNPLGAESRLRSLLERYPDTDVSAEGLVTFGDHFRKRGDLVRAALAYAAVLETYPKSSHAERAREALASLEAKDVRPSEQPLVALTDTLGRPSLRPESKAPAPVTAPAGEPAAQVDRPQVIR